MIDTGSKTDSTLQYYEVNAETICKRYETASLEDINALLVNLLRPQARVLELGCGSGRDGAFFYCHGFDWWGVEGSLAMACQSIILHPNLRGRIVRADIRQPLPFIKDSFEGVFCIAALMHLRATEVVHVLEQAYLLLKKGKPMVISIPLVRTDVNSEGYSADGRFFLSWAKDQWIDVIEATGFKPIQCRERTDGLGRDIIWLTIAAKRGENR